MPPPPRSRVVLIVLDSVGIGEAPDAAEYGDEGCATAQHAAAAAGGLNAPVLRRLGLGNAVELLPDGRPIAGLPPTAAPEAGVGAMQEVSQGKDTITGHWEIAGLDLRPGFTTFPPQAPSFPPAVLDPFIRETGRDVLGNAAASGTEVIERLGPEHLATGRWIVYTSSDSVMQIAAHLDVAPLDELYRACRIARRLCDPFRVGRVIARPFEGVPGAFRRTKDRRDFAFEPDEPTLLQRLDAAGVPVCAVGKIEDIYAHRGITKSDHTGDTESSQRAVERFFGEIDHGLVFANFIDFDMLYGHRRDPVGYARAIEQTDRWLGGFLPRLRGDDLLILTADHGNDPTFKGTDHTREFVPLLVFRPEAPPPPPGLRVGFYDVAQSLAFHFGIPPLPRGRAFL